VGLIVAFRELFRGRYRLLNTKVAASFAAYLLHPPIVIALQAAIAAVTLPALKLFALPRQVIKWIWLMTGFALVV
jgi:hypothetical protein